MNSPAMAGHELRTAFITGASGGIGEALARLLADHGLEVGIAARREDELARIADEIARAGGRARPYPLDVTDPARVQATLGRADDELGGIDLVIANAGIAAMRWSGKTDWAHCAPMLGVNVIGATATLIALLPRMVERKRGHVVGVSSIAAYRGLPKLAVYSASKAYLSAFLEALRVDLAGAGVHVTDVRPGYVRTAMNADSKRKLPFLMEASAAAQEIWDAIVARKAVHAFPLPVATAMRSIALLPNVFYDRMAGKVL
jgi:short-subunit dehydrogenase